MSPDEPVFFKTLGARISELRKAQGLTQQQLAEPLQIAQQTLAHYECRSPAHAGVFAADFLAPVRRTGR